MILVRRKEMTQIKSWPFVVLFHRRKKKLNKIPWKKGEKFFYVISSNFISTQIDCLSRSHSMEHDPKQRHLQSPFDKLKTKKKISITCFTYSYNTYILCIYIKKKNHWLYLFIPLQLIPLSDFYYRFVFFVSHHLFK